MFASVPSLSCLYNLHSSVRMVSMYERRMCAESFSVTEEKQEEQQLCIEEPSHNQLKFNEAVTEFSAEKYIKTEIDTETRLKIRFEELSNRSNYNLHNRCNIKLYFRLILVSCAK